MILLYPEGPLPPPAKQRTRDLAFTAFQDFTFVRQGFYRQNFYDPCVVRILLPLRILLSRGTPLHGQWLKR